MILEFLEMVKRATVYSIVTPYSLRSDLYAHFGCTPSLR